MLDFTKDLQQWGIWHVALWIVLTVAAIWLVIYLATRDPGRRETVLLSLPVLRKVFRRNLIARWCDAIAVGVSAGMDLPAAISMADDAIGSPRLRMDGSAITDALSQGRPITDISHGRIIPPLVVAAMDAAAARNDLPSAMESLSQSYQQQAEAALLTAQTVMAPAVLIVIGLLVFLLITLTLLPMLDFIMY